MANINRISLPSKARWSTKCRELPLTFSAVPADEHGSRSRGCSVELDGEFDPRRARAIPDGDVEPLAMLAVPAGGGDVVVVADGSEVEDGGAHVVYLDGVAHVACLVGLLLDGQQVVGAWPVWENCHACTHVRDDLEFDAVIFALMDARTRTHNMPRFLVKLYTKKMFGQGLEFQPRQLICTY